MHKGVAIFVVMTGLSIGVTGCGSDGGGSAPEGTVDVTLTDFKFALSDTSTPAGTVTFRLDNKGPSVHEFVVFQTELAPDALPVDDAGDVAEGDAFAPVDEVEDIGLGNDQELAVDLAAGKYVLVCNIAAHYRQGMRTAFTVT